ncbi:MAG TPA: ABC transporter permease [Candidatus Binatia bacterium]|nr:ABC transporter permease [Candidatus Binatia bacterium]
MGASIAGRIALTVPTLLLVSGLVFSLLLLLPGDPVLLILGPEASPEERQTLARELGTDRPVPVQYLAWLTRALQGDLGRSPRTQQPVVRAIGERLPPTLELAGLGMALAIAGGGILGLAAAWRPGSWLDRLSLGVCTLGVAVPTFWLGILLVLGLSLHLGLVPPSGYVPPREGLVANLRAMVLPAITVAATMGAVIARTVRASVVEVAGETYVVTARAKGLPEVAVFLRHVLRNALAPILAVVGLQVGRLMGGMVITETIFAIPGIGRLAVDSVLARDFLTVQGVVLVMAVWVLLANLAVDVLHLVADPRIRRL